MRRDWWVPLSGVGFVVLVIVGFIVGGEPPDIDEPVQEAVDFYRDDKDSIEIGAAIQTMAALLLVVFGSFLRGALSAADTAQRVLPSLTFAGAIILATGTAIDATISFSLAEAAEDV